MNKEHLHIIKIGGNIIDDDDILRSFILSLNAITGPCMLVHGGGKAASRMGQRLGLEPAMVNGRRITDESTLEVVTMVYAGLVNKKIVAGLQSTGKNALGLTGADGNIILAHKRLSGGVDFGFAGDIDLVNHAALHSLLGQGFLPVLAPLTHNGKGQLLNTNADTIAAATAIAMAGLYRVTLIYCFEKEGVLAHVEDETSVIPQLDKILLEEMKNNNQVHTGMLPKLENAFDATTHDVEVM
ncbi:MAG: acetylglutamate kinase, partial [Ferruginibacter sp.]